MVLQRHNRWTVKPLLPFSLLPVRLANHPELRGWPSATAHSIFYGYSAAWSVYSALGSKAQAGREPVSLWLAFLRFLVPGNA